MEAIWNRKIYIIIALTALMVLVFTGCEKDPEMPEDEPEDPYVPVYDQGSGTKEDPWLISNPRQLDSIRNNLGSHYRLIADIDLVDYLADTSWVPIGDKSNKFIGALDGNSHTITGLSLRSEGSSRTMGFFRYTDEEALIKNLIFDNVDIHRMGPGEGVSVSGAIAGNNKGEIRNCSVRIAAEGAMGYLGGLVGINIGYINGCQVDVDIKNWPTSVGGLVCINEGIIHDCYTSGIITSEEILHAGGIVLANLGTISECHSSVDIINNRQTAGAIGGFAGWQDASGTIRNSYSTGNIDIVVSIPPFYTFADGLVVGGFIGGGRGDIIENSYTTGDVSVTIGIGDFRGAYIDIGGFSGEGGNLTNCYAAGKVTGINTGGLVGANMVAEVISSYYDSEVTGQSDTENGTPKTTMEMMQQATFEGWDFTSVWAIDEGTSYPYLRWQEDDNL